MTEFPLDIVTPDGEIFSGRAESLRLRSIEGDLCIRARHTDYVTALGMGPAEVITAGNKHIAACMGGMVSVLGGRVTLTATTFEWAEDIDTARSHASEERAREKLGHGDLTDTELAMAEARLKRALIRQGAAEWLRQLPDTVPFRYDIVEVMYREGEVPEITRLCGAFGERDLAAS